MQLLTGLKIVILDHPSMIWDHPIMKDMMYRVFRLKLQGFGHELTNQALPLDTSDFITTHLALCKRDGKQLIPIMAFKMTTLERVQVHDLTFPALTLVQQANSVHHINYINDVIKNSQQNAFNIAYTASWTIDPNVRKDRAFTATLRDIFKAMYTLAGQYYDVRQIITGSTPRFQTDSICEELGHRPFIINNKELPLIDIPHLHGQRVRMMHLTEYSSKALEASKRWSNLWDDRIEISKEEIKERNKKVA